MSGQDQGPAPYRREPPQFERDRPAHDVAPRDHRAPQFDLPAILQATGWVQQADGWYDPQTQHVFDYRSAAVEQMVRGGHAPEAAQAVVDASTGNQ